jgi:hypothetical protein
MRKTVFFTAILTLLTLALAPSALAQSNAADHTEKLRSLFSDFLQDQAEKLQAATPPATLTQEGPIDVEKAGAYYAVTLPQLSIKTDNGPILQIGMISINVTPAPNPGEWKMTMALPTPISGFEADGREHYRIDLGSQKTAGIWNEALRTFTTIDAQYKDIAVTFPHTRGSIRVPDFLMRYDLNMVDKGLWSGPIFWRILNADWSLPSEGEKGSAEKISLLITADQLSESVLRQLIERPTSFFSAYDPALWSAAKSLKTEIELVNFSSQSEKTAAQTAEQRSAIPFSARIAHLNSEFGFDNDPTSNTATVKLSGKFDGLAVTGLAPEFSELIPAEGTLNLAHKNIPVKSLNAAFANGGMNAAMALFKIPALLAQAKSTIESEGSSLRNDTYTINLSAIILADIAAVANATAQGRLSFEGLDKVLSIAQVNSASTRQSSYTDFFKNLADFLERIKTFARIETNASKNFVHVYDFKMDQSGVLTINDQETSAVLWNSMPAAAPAAVQRAP